MNVNFKDWTNQRQLLSIGTNAGAASLPFQNWRHFKEAFAPEVVEKAFSESKIKVNRCLDPFGGSGTTALASQFLGAHPIIMEVNPFLADLIAAKLESYDVDSLVKDLSRILQFATNNPIKLDEFRHHLPMTFVEPGVGERWLFDAGVASKIWSLRAAIESLGSKVNANFFKVILGGQLSAMGNFVVSGKGRRYRKGWQRNRRSPALAELIFAEAAGSAISEVARYSSRATRTFELLCGDSRELTKRHFDYELSVFSPPYPNSFDYTDVYNVELWMLGYLTGTTESHALRRKTLSSHVQVSRSYAPAPSGSKQLNETINALEDQRPLLWNKNIPEMIGGYFAELDTIVCNVSASLSAGGAIWIVVGDSQYANVCVKSAKILADLGEAHGLKATKLDEFRFMRASAQQGGQFRLAESLLVLQKD